MTDTLTVPEILGWEWKTLEGRRWLCPPDSASTSVAAVSPEAARITVDDMLDWLRDRGWLATAASSTPWRDDPGGIRLSVWTTKTAIPAITSPTLHEALSAAVLAVAEREEPTDDR